MGKIINAVLNGSEYGFDSDTGCLRSIIHPVAGQMLDPDSGGAGLIDMAFPYGKFEILRIGSKYSTGARVVVSEGEVTITLDRLGQNFVKDGVQGAVKATVMFTEAPDGISVIMSAKVENSSSNEVRQVLFPDIDAVTPTEGADSTFHTCCGFRSRPFVELREPEYGENDPYNLKPSMTGVMYRSGGYITKHTVHGIWREMIGHWFDIGGYRGGFSVHRRWWGWGPDNIENKQRYYWHKLDQQAGLLRIAAMHSVRIKPGETWKSDDYWLTPHQGGWAQGIKPYAAWVGQNFSRIVPMPRHIKEGLGSRTLWMTEQFTEEPSSVVWKFSDLPEVSRESKEHGIDEIVLWNAADWDPPFVKESVHESLGGHQSYKEAVGECKKIGVNISHFVSFMTIYGENNKRYGLTPRGPETSWTYHSTMVPVFRPDYGMSCVSAWVDQDNELWQQDLRDSFVNFFELGITSISWDQFLVQYGKDRGLPSLIEEYRKAAYEIDPDSTFNGESMMEIEIESRYMDYTWDWLYYSRGNVDRCGFLNAFPSPRLNIHIESNPMDVKHSFMDNLYLTVFPSKPGGINGSARFNELPKLSAALKLCAALRRQFLDYFTQARIIGDCVLTSECKDARVTAYLQENSMLIIILRDTDENLMEKRVTFNADVTLWLGSGVYNRKIYNTEGTLVREDKAESVFAVSSDMEYGEFAFVELAR